MPLEWSDSLGHDIESGLVLTKDQFPQLDLKCIMLPLGKIVCTSIVSKTLMTPGCLKVLDLRTAFFAKGSRDLFAAISNVKTLHAEPSS